MRARRGVFSLLALLLVAGLGLVIPVSLAAPAQAANGDGALRVRVVREVNANGTYNQVLEPGVPKVQVRVSDATGHRVDLTTDASGVATLSANNGTLVGGKYRVEVVNPKPKQLYPAIADPAFAPSAGAGGINDGAKIGSSVMFVDLSGGKEASATTGFWTGADYCQSNPRIVTACQPPAIDGLTGLPIELGFDNGFMTTYSMNYNGLDVARQIANKADTGTTYGIGYSRIDKRVFSGAYAKRGTRYGPGGAGAIYVTAANASGPTKLFTTVPNAGNTQHNMWGFQDVDFRKVIGKESLGDLEVSADGKWLYAVNLNDRKIYVYDATQSTALAPNYVISTTSISCASGTWRPFALAEEDGEMFIGGVCDDASRAMVFSFDTSAMKQGSGQNQVLNVAFTKVMDEPMKYWKDPAVLPPFGGICPGGGPWLPWSDSLPFQCVLPVLWQAAPTPMLSDITFRADGQMVVSFRDRTVDQFGSGSLGMVAFNSIGLPIYVKTSPGGDTNLACRNSSGQYVLDENGGCTGLSNPVTGEFFYDMSGLAFVHQEATFSGVALSKAETSLVTNMVDPTPVVGIFSQGTFNLDQWNGLGSFRDGNIAGNPRTTLIDIGKSQGLADIEVLCDLAPIQIGNRVWYDADGDGAQDPNEAPISGVTVELVNANGAVVATTTTNAQGEYYFDSRKDGVKYETDYTIRVKTDQPALKGYQPTVADATDPIAVNPDAVDSDGKISTGVNDVISIRTGTAGQNNHTYDFGFSKNVSIGDYVWWDFNRNGLQDADEAPVPNVEVKLLNPDGSPVLDANGQPRVTKTDADGYYYFADLSPSTDYKVVFVKPEQTTFTTQNVNNNGNDAADSDPNADGEVLVKTPATGQNQTGPNKADDPTIDAGLVQLDLALAKEVTSTGPYSLPAEGIYSTVTYKLTPHNNGPVDALAGWSVTDLIPTNMKITNMSGANYTCSFADGATGTCVSSVVLPRGKDGDIITVTATITGPPTRADGLYHNVAYVSPAKDEITETNPLVIPVRDTTNTADTKTNNDAQADVTLRKLASIGDYVWYDTNRDGLQGDKATEPPAEGVKVFLYDSTGTKVLRETTTNADGYYYFQNLEPNTDYVVKFVAPAGTVFTQKDAQNGTQEATDSDADPATGFTRAYKTPTEQQNPKNLAQPGLADVPTIDAGLIKLVSMGDYVWYDDNRDGLQTPGELPVAGVQVKLLDAAGNPVKDAQGNARVATTNKDGYYWFTDLMPGTNYQVQFVAPARTIFTTQDVDGNASQALDSDADRATGIAKFTTPDTGNNKPGAKVTDEPKVDAGLVREIDLTIKKTLETQGVVVPGESVVFTLVPQNYGPADAIAGWSVVDVPQTGLTITQIQGAGVPSTYKCTLANLTCVSSVGLKAGAKGEAIQVVATVDSNFRGTTLKNVTYVAPAKDEIIETIPLDIPTIDTDTSNSKTNNDDQVWVPVAPKVSIGDYVWYDTNRDGVQGPRDLEPVAPGVKVELFKDGVSQGATRTDANGYYGFTGLEPNTAYTLVFTKPAGYSWTDPNRGGDRAKDSDVDLNGKVNIVTPASGKNQSDPSNGVFADDPTWDAGLVKPMVSIGDYVWFDDNRDGLQTAGEPGVADVVVSLLDKDGKPVLGTDGKPRTTTTGPNGYYFFKDLEPNTEYKLHFEKPANTVFTTQNVDNNASDARDSDPDANGDLVIKTPASGNNQIGVDATDNPTFDAGLVRQIDLELAKKVSSPGPYKVGGPVEFTLTPQNNGPADAIAGWSVTDIIPTGMEITAMSGDGYTCTVASDKITATCVAGAGLKAGAKGNPITVKATIIAAPTTAQNGEYRNVAYVKPADKEVTETNPLVVPTRDMTTPTKDTPTNNDADAPVNLQPKVSIGDYVWFDTNRNGLQDTTEKPVPNVKVTITGPNGFKAETTTDANGYYFFKDLDPNTQYSLNFQKPADTVFTTPNVNNNGNDAADSDPDANGDLVITTPLSGKNETGPNATDNPTFDAGLVPPIDLLLAKQVTSTGPYSVGSTVEFALRPSNAGPSDALKGWSVTDLIPTGMQIKDMFGADYTCTVANDKITGTCVSSVGLKAGDKGNVITVVATIIAEPTAAQNGEYKNVAYVKPADNEVKETVPLIVPVRDTTDTTKDDTNNDAEAKVSLLPKVSVGDYVWYDTNRNGLQDPTEKPVPNVKVTITDPKGVTTTTTTGADGYYYFPNLDPNTQYTIHFEKPADTVFTTPNVNNNGNDAADSDPDANGNVVITTPASGKNQTGPNATDNPTFDAGLVPQIDLTLLKQVVGSGPFKVGDTVNYQLKPRNRGPADALAGWSVTDIIPTGMEITAMAGDGYTCTVATDKITGTCVSSTGLKASPDDAPVYANTVTVTAKITAEPTSAQKGQYKNVAYVKPADNEVTESNPLVVPVRDTTDTVTSPTNNDAEAILGLQPKIDLTIVKRLVTTGVVNPGGQVTFTLSPFNNGPADAKAGWSVTEVLPAGLSLVSMTGAGYDCSGVTCVARAGLANQQNGPVITVVAKVDDNFTGSSLRNVTYVSPAPGEVPETNPLVVPPPGTDTSNTPTNNDSHVDVPVAPAPKIDLTIFKELATKGPFKAGDDVSWFVNPKNLGPNDAKAGWSVTEVLPPGLTLVSMSGSGYDCSGLTCVARAGLAAGANGPAILVVTKIDANFTGTTLRNVTFVSPAPGEVPETNPLVVPPANTDTSKTDTNNDAHADVPVVVAVAAAPAKVATPVIDLQLTKTVLTQGPVAPGATVTFSLVPRNNGPDAAMPGWSVTDVLPAGLTLVSMSGDGYDCTALTCTAKAGLAAGANGPVITVVTKVAANATGSLDNKAYVVPNPKDVAESNPMSPTPPTSSTNTDATPTNNDSQASIGIAQPLAGGGGGKVKGNPPKGASLPSTGSPVTPTTLFAGIGMLMIGMTLLVSGRRRKAASES